MFCGLAAKSCLTLATPWTVARQAPLSMGFSRQEYWSGLLFPYPGDLPDLTIKPTSLISPILAGRFFATRVTWEALPPLRLIPDNLQTKGSPIHRNTDPKGSKYLLDTS